MNETTPDSLSEPARTRPSHDDIARHAQELWDRYGRPSGRDEEIWLEAERALQAAAPVTPDNTGGDRASPASTPAGSNPESAGSSRATATPKTTSIRPPRASPSPASRL